MDERMHDYLSRNHITWQFNLSRAPSEVSYSEAAKTGLLSQSKELILLDQNSNKLFQMPKLLSITTPYLTLYVEEDKQLHVLTPQSRMFRQPNLLSKEGFHSVKDKDLRKSSRYLGVGKMCYGPDGE